MRRLIRAGVAVAFGAVLCSAVVAGPLGWRQDGTGRFPKATPPLEWSKDSNILWKKKLPGPGFGSPVVVGERIFVVSNPAELLCLRASDGKELWQQSNALSEVYGKEKAAAIAKQYEGLEKTRNEAGRDLNKLRKELRDDGINPDKKDELDKETRDKLAKARTKVTEAERAIRKLQETLPRKERGGQPGNTAATPACDDKHVAAVFGTGIVAVYTTAGIRRWIKFIETPTIGFGHSASPILVRGKLIVHLKDLVALEPATGKELWRVPMSARRAASIVARLGKEDVLITPSGSIVRVRDGKVLSKGKFSVSESSPLLEDGIIYASHSGRIQALKLSKSEEGEAVLEEQWKVEAARDRRTPSSVLHDGLLYAVNTSGMLEAIDTKKGEQVYKRRLPIGQVYSSITLAGGYLFVQDLRGKTVVFKPGRKYEQVALNQLEGTGACPVFVGRRLYLRGQQHLYCIAAKDKPKEDMR